MKRLRGEKAVNIHGLFYLTKIHKKYKFNDRQWAIGKGVIGNRENP